ncbi:hypothetical protein KR49_00155 [Synechococcus sp. KORDI-49]|nr:hypothetical protein KR49_00155 [Synechococcus sp. KORDI-49]
MIVIITFTRNQGEGKGIAKIRILGIDDRNACLSRNIFIDCVN